MLYTTLCDSPFASTSTASPPDPPSLSVVIKPSRATRMPSSPKESAAAATDVSARSPRRASRRPYNGCTQCTCHSGADAPSSQDQDEVEAASRSRRGTGADGNRGPVLRPSPRPRQPREPARAPEDRSDDETDDDDDEDGEVSPLESSEELLAPESLAPSSLSTVRSRLFASDDEDDYGDILEDDGILSMSGGDSCGSAFSPGSLLSLASPARRASLSIEAATSDPLRHSLSSPPTLEFDHVRQRGHWIPARSAPTSETVWNAPDVPDVVVRPATPSVPTSPSTTPPSSPPRGATTPSGRPESLLSKSLRSLARLPNLTLADVLPRAAVPVPEEDLTALPPGWGPAERRRVLAAEPSHAADEARAGFRYLLRRPPSPFSAGRRLAAAAVASGSRKSVEFGHPIDEVEALGYGFGFGLQDLGCAASPAALAPDAGSGDEEDNLAQLRARAPTSPSADVPPLPPRALERPRSKESSPPADPVPAPSSIPVTDDDESPVEASAPLSPPPSLPPRFISNHRHLLMLSLEFEMMRHAKIRGPLRQRAVIVRQATSPPRERGVTRERSRLSQEVNLVGAA